MRPLSFLSFLLIPGLGAAAACSVTAPGSAFVPGTMVVNTTGSMDGGDAALGASPEDDGGSGDAAVATLQQNNVLCAVTTTCDPDSPETASSCHVAPDGGAYDPSADYDSQPLACRVQPATSIASEGIGLPTACSVAGAGTAGDTCTAATDCAAGYDCTGSGTCRHYCCAGNAQCAGHDAGVPEEFCDIQALATATTTKVPVCMPIDNPGCSLRSALSNAPTGAPPPYCEKGQTCAIVREDGTTGCVEAGPQTAGEACNTDHCADGLVCLGALNARKCYALCLTSGSGACPSPMTCQGGLPLFQDPTVGVCR